MILAVELATTCTDDFPSKALRKKIMRQLHLDSDHFCNLSP